MNEKTSLRRPISCCDNRKSKIQNRKWAVVFAIVVALTVCGAKAEAQQPGKVHRVGYLSARGAVSLPRSYSEAFRQGLRDLGYVEGKNILVEYRYIEGNPGTYTRLYSCPS